MHTVGCEDCIALFHLHHLHQWFSTRVLSVQSVRCFTNALIEGYFNSPVQIHTKVFNIIADARINCMSTHKHFFRFSVLTVNESQHDYFHLLLLIKCCFCLRQLSSLAPGFLKQSFLWFHTTRKVKNHSPSWMFSMILKSYHNSLTIFYFFAEIKRPN